MTKSHAMKWVCVAGVVGALSVYAFNPVVGADDSDEAETPLVESARKAFQSAQIAFDNDMITMEDFYHWSRRLMQAELRENPSNKKPMLDHLNRMTKLHEKITAMFQAGARGADTYRIDASAYYVEAAKADALLVVKTDSLP